MNTVVTSGPHIKSFSQKLKVDANHIFLLQSRHSVIGSWETGLYSDLLFTNEWYLNVSQMSGILNTGVSELYTQSK